MFAATVKIKIALYQHYLQNNGFGVSTTPHRIELFKTGFSKIGLPFAALTWHCQNLKKSAELNGGLRCKLQQETQTQNLKTRSLTIRPTNPTLGEAPKTKHCKYTLCDNTRVVFCSDVA
eukprot:4891749-Amphidinium_carterae.1